MYVHSVGGSCALKGTQLYDWLARLAPHLTGDRTIAELVGPLPADQATMVEKLVGVLAEQHFVLDAGADTAHTLTPDEQRCYADEIDFIRYGLDSAEHRFERFRQARIALLGSGPMLAAVLEAGLGSGWRDVRVLAPPSEELAVSAVVERSRRDAAQLVSFSTATEGLVPGDVDVILQICQVSQRGELVRTARMCTRGGAALGQMLVDSAEAWLTPVGPTSRLQHESCWSRLAAAPGDEIATDRDWLTGPALNLLAAQFSLSCFSYLTGLEQPVDGPVLNRVDLAQLETSTHNVRPLTVTGPWRAEAVAEKPPLTADEIFERARSFIDSRTGVLRVFAEEELPQVPIAVCRARVAAGGGTGPDRAALPEVMGWAIESNDARLHALFAALATYSCLVRGAGEELQGIDLVTGQPRQVSTARLYSDPHDTPAPYRAPVGAAAGLSWNDAVAAGLMAQCEALLEEREVASGSQVRIDDDQPEADLLRLLRAVGCEPHITDLSGDLGVPAFAVQVPGGPPLLCCSLAEGLRRCLLSWQGVLDADPVTRWSEGCDEATRRAMVAALHRAGGVPVVVPIAQDEAVKDLLPFVVRVVVCHD